MIRITLTAACVAALLAACTTANDAAADTEKQASATTSPAAPADAIAPPAAPGKPFAVTNVVPFTLAEVQTILPWPLRSDQKSTPSTSRKCFANFIPCGITSPWQNHADF